MIVHSRPAGYGRTAVNRRSSSARGMAGRPFGGGTRAPRGARRRRRALAARGVWKGQRAGSPARVSGRGSGRPPGHVARPTGTRDCEADQARQRQDPQEEAHGRRLLVKRGDAPERPVDATVSRDAYISAGTISRTAPDAPARTAAARVRPGTISQAKAARFSSPGSSVSSMSPVGHSQFPAGKNAPPRPLGGYSHAQAPES